MSSVVIYRSRYGSTKQYAEWISQELNCDIFDVKNVKPEDVMKYDNIIYGGGLYAEMIAGIAFVNKNISKWDDKKVVVFTTGITPLECREYYEGEVMDKTFTKEAREKVKVFNFLGKMKKDELNFAHKLALSQLKKIMSAKKNPTELEKMLVELCDFDDDLTDKNAIYDLIKYVKE